MEIKLTRIARRKDYTIGRMEIDNEYILKSAIYRV